MAILKSIITEGAKGSMGNVTLRQVCGQTVASQKRIGRAYSKLSTQQKEQCSAFKWVVKCLQYAPLYPQIAFARLDNKSGYNRCVGLLVDAVNQQGIPGDISFPMLVEKMDANSSQVALGLPTRGRILFLDAGSNNMIVEADNFILNDVLHVWYTVSGELRARYKQAIIDDEAEFVLQINGGFSYAIAVVTHDGIPYTFDSSALYF